MRVTSGRGVTGRRSECKVAVSYTGPVERLKCFLFTRYSVGSLLAFIIWFPYNVYMRNFRLNPVPSNDIIPQERRRSPAQTKSFDELCDALADWGTSLVTDEPLPMEAGYDIIKQIKRMTPNVGNLAWILPALLRLGGQPYSLAEHFEMEPLFNVDLPARTLLKCGRQVSKSTSYAASIVLHSVAIPNFKTLYVAPLKEHTQKFSMNYLQPFLDSMTLARTLVTSRGSRVLQKDLLNGSRIFLHYAYTSAERIRGISADKLVVDEVQMVDTALLPVIYECLSHSLWDLRYYSGTPATFDNTIEQLWQDSSQAEWLMKCACGHNNFATLEDGVMDMIQKKGLCCIKCGRVLNPGDPNKCGWYHRVGQKRKSFTGYHIPQVILPLHYSNPQKWRDILEKKRTFKYFHFVNEVLGESCDVGAKLLTTEDIKRVSTLHKNDIKEASKHIKEYPLRVLGVDWGGGGQDDVSFTAPVVAGARPDGKIDILYMERLSNEMSHDEEIARIMQIYRRFDCRKLCHDAAGAGQRPSMLVHAGFDKRDMVPLWYSGALQNFIVYHPPKKHFNQAFYTLQKSNSIRILCDVIRTEGMFFPAFDSSWEFTSDFMSIGEEAHVSGDNEMFLIVKTTDKRPDDFVHSLVYASVTLWSMLKKFPDLAKGYDLKYDASVLDRMQSI